MFAKTRIFATAMVAVSLGMGLAACSPSPTNTAAPTSGPAVSSASPAGSTATSASADASASSSAAGSTTASATAAPGGTKASADNAKTAEGANATFNDFMATVKVEAVALKSDPNFKFSDLTAERVTKAFPKSLAFLDTAQFPGDKAARVIIGFAPVYYTAPDATIVSKDAADMAVSGDTATIQSNAITVTANGTERQGRSAGGTMTLTYTGGEWKITGYTVGS